MPLVGVLGWPVGHSRSPAIHEAAFAALGMTGWRYQKLPVPPALFAETARALAGAGFAGANVTIPHKQAVRAYLDTLDPAAERIGAVNTIAREGDRLIGYNTDAPGFLRSLVEVGGFDPQGAEVLVLGAGGAARAVAVALLDGGAARITLTNRTAARARELADQLARLGRVSVVEWEGEERAAAARSADLIVNATALGMAHGPAPEVGPLAADAIRAGVVVYDLVYVPARTPLLDLAARQGARVIEGLPMLIYQGAIAFERWFGRPAPIEVMTRAAEAALRDRRPWTVDHRLWARGPR